jgi:hypothetical protein
MITLRDPNPDRQYPTATLVWSADRYGTAYTDGGAQIEVIIPGRLFCNTGDRVAMTRYPQGWVVIARYVFPAPEHGTPR